MCIIYVPKPVNNETKKKLVDSRATFLDQHRTRSTSAQKSPENEKLPDQPAKTTHDSIEFNSFEVAKFNHRIVRSKLVRMLNEHWWTLIGTRVHGFNTVSWDGRDHQLGCTTKKKKHMLLRKVASQLHVNYILPPLVEVHFQTLLHFNPF